MLQGLEINLTIPDLWQQQAVRALKEGKDVVVDAPTGAGKTWVFELFFEQGNLGGQAVYTVPTRALANDKWAEWKKHGWEVGIATGDLAENTDAPVIVATLETQRERLLVGEGPALLVVDEYQMIADEARGLNYELAMALAPEGTQLLLLSGSVENPHEIAAWLEHLGRAVELVEVLERPVPLDEEVVESLPRAPDSIKGFWPIVAARALMADIGPLLIFAPHRNDAEKIARKIAAALPDDDPIVLPDEMAHVAGKDLARLLRSRVAFHHSGLSYGARAGIIEPLAKKGQLRVVVATMGLAAGINFSVRTVLVSDTLYKNGPFLEQLRPDELLQMFGRAGRRGMDEVGYVLVTRKSPSLMDASPRRLQRVNEIDWPTLLRVMEARPDAPFEAAREVCGRLFSRQDVLLGIERRARALPDAGEEASPFNLGPHRRELLNSDQEWEIANAFERSESRLEDCWVRHGEKWRRALRSPAFAKTLGKGNLCKIRNGRGFIYGIESKVARRVDGERWEPLPWVRKLARLKGRVRFSESDLSSAVLSRVEAASDGGRITRQVMRGELLAVQLDFSEKTTASMVDSSGRALIDPPQRRVSIEVETRYAGEIDPPTGSAAFAWRKLGLVDASGRPTLRGRIFSRFQRGEGLMIAAALEDASYPIDELIWHLANIRAGFRFDDTGGGGSERLAAAARSVYGIVDHRGYLELGLCPGYGEGAAEVLEAHLGGKKRIGDLVSELLSGGDIERGLVEWLSLLRHVVHAADIEDPRWRAFQAAAREMLQKRRALTRSAKVPELPLAVLNQRVRLRLSRGRFR